jgi:hypothetical protein
LSYRRAAVLIAHLPPESATKSVVRDGMSDDELDEQPEPDGHGRWSHVELLLAAISDAMNVLVWQNARIHGNTKAAAPEPIRRPGVRSTSAPKISLAGVTYLNELRERRRAQRGDSGR